MASTIMDPTGRKDSEGLPEFAPAPRQADLAGTTVGLLENGKQNARLFLEEVGTVLRDRYGVASVDVRRKGNFAAPEPAEVIDEIRSGCAGVVIGVGD